MGRKKKTDENITEEIEEEKKIDLTPNVGTRRKYSGSVRCYNTLRQKINEYLSAPIEKHTFIGLANYLQCWPEHLKELESGKIDRENAKYKVSDLIKQFRLYMEDELYSQLPLKEEKDVVRLAGKPPEETNKEKEAQITTNKYAG